MSDEPKPKKAKPGVVPRPKRMKGHAFLYRMTEGQRIRFLTCVWVMQQAPDHKKKPWTRQRVLDLALQKLIRDLEKNFADGELPDLDMATLESLK